MLAKQLFAVISEDGLLMHSIVACFSNQPPRDYRVETRFAHLLHQKVDSWQGSYKGLVGLSIQRRVKKSLFLYSSNEPAP